MSDDDPGRLRQGRARRSAGLEPRRPWCPRSSWSSCWRFIPLVWRNDYIISLLMLILLFSLMTQSWNLTIGMCGIWNFGQLAIIAIGGYATGLLTIKLGMSAWLALPVGVLAGGLAAVIMVLPSIRLRGIYASMLTFAFAEVVRLLIIADSSGFTGGPFGLTRGQGAVRLPLALLEPARLLLAHARALARRSCCSCTA